MIIRSQDKTGIVIYENVSAIYVIDDDYKKWFEIRHSGNDVSGTLGTYSTEAKAIKVLDMICDSYQYMKECECTRKALGVHAPEFVFQMPQDSEV